MNPVLLDLGFIKIYWYSIMILLGIFVGGSFIIKESKRFKIPEDYIINLILNNINGLILQKYYGKIMLKSRRCYQCRIYYNF